MPNPFQFTGAMLDSSTGLYKMGERYYDPSVGRFTQEDPISPCTGSRGQYTYANGDPVNETDAQGTSSVRSGKKKKHKRRHSRTRPKPTPTNTPVPIPTPVPHSSFRERFASCLGARLGEISDACLGVCVSCGDRPSGFNPFCYLCAACAEYSIGTVIRCVKESL